MRSGPSGERASRGADHRNLGARVPAGGQRRVGLWIVGPLTGEAFLREEQAEGVACSAPTEAALDAMVTG